MTRYLRYIFVAACIGVVFGTSFAGAQQDSARAVERNQLRRLKGGRAGSRQPIPITITPTGYATMPAPGLQSAGRVFGQIANPPVDSLRSPPSLPPAVDTAGKNIAQVAASEDLPKGVLDTANLNFKDTDLRDIFRALSVEHGLNIFLDNSFNKKTTIALTKVKVIDAINFLASENGLIVERQGAIFKIAPPPPMKTDPPPPKVPAVFYADGAFSVELKNDDLEKVVLEIEHKTGFNILIMNGTTGLVTGTLSRVEFDIGFTQLMNNNGFAVQKKNGIYLVSRLDYFVGAKQTPGEQQQAASGPYWVAVKDSLVTIDVTNAPLNRIIPDMVRQLNTDVVFYANPEGTVTAHATNVRLDRALDMILRNTAYSYVVSDGLYFIGEKTNKSLTVTKLLKLKYLKPETIMDMVPQSISSQAVLKPVKEHNGIVIISSNDVIDAMKDFLQQVDKPVAQVLIEALVVDYDITHSTDFGIEAGLNGRTDTSGIQRSGSLYPGIDLQGNGDWANRMLKKMGSVNVFGKTINMASLGVLPSDFYVRLKALEEKGVANIKSRPLIATLNGHQASLSIGTTQYYLLKTTTPYRDATQVVFQQTETFQTIEADVKLEITPFVGADSTIMVEIKPDFRSPVGQLTANVPPTINRRALSSTIVVKEGETIVLGGLVQDEESEMRSQVPILGSIPWLGNLFSSTSKSNRKTELLIYVTPHISYGEQFQQANLSDQPK